MAQATKTIMIIDDEKPLAGLISDLLADKGYKTVTAHNGVEGLRKLKKVQPHLILLDLIMPEMGGIEFYRNICGPDSRPKYPVVIFTARADMEATFRDINVDSFVAKHTEAEKLFAEIDKVLKAQVARELKARQLAQNQDRTLLIVDDNQRTAGKMAMALSAAGYRIAIAEDEVKTIEYLNYHKPDLMLMRLQLKDTSGDLFVLKLREIYRMKGVKCVLYYVDDRAYIEDKITEQMEQKSGIVGLYKFVHPPDFVDKINNVFDNLQRD